MPRCYIVPGTLLSQLYLDSDQKNLLWPDYQNLALGYFGAMRLAANGIDPGPPDGRELYVGIPLPDYYGYCYSKLISDINPHGWEVSLFGWDWRKHFFLAGEQLAAEILNDVPVGDYCAIVGHSAGGLVARAAWASLAVRGLSDRIRRIITLGTPHQGTYDVVETWSGGDDQMIGQLATLSLIGQGLGGTGAFPGARGWTKAQIVQLSASWPLLYDLLPVLGSGDSEQDPFRIKVFASSSWLSGPSLSQDHLTYSAELVSPWQLSLVSRPPAWVMTTLSGTGRRTPQRLIAPFFLGALVALGQTDQGDGAVTSDSALMANSAQFVSSWAHQDMPRLAAESGWLGAAVLDPRGPPSPPPPIELLTDRDYTLYYGPPFIDDVQAPPGPGSCGLKPCNC